MGCSFCQALVPLIVHFHSLRKRSKDPVPNQQLLTTRWRQLLRVRIKYSFYSSWGQECVCFLKGCWGWHLVIYGILFGAIGVRLNLTYIRQWGWTWSKSLLKVEQRRGGQITGHWARTAGQPPSPSRAKISQVAGILVLVTPIHEGLKPEDKGSQR